VSNSSILLFFHAYNFGENVFPTVDLAPTRMDVFSHSTLTNSYATLRLLEMQVYYYCFNYFRHGDNEIASVLGLYAMAIGQMMKQ